MRQLKTFFSAFAAVILVISIMGASVSYHECFLRGEHDFHSALFENDHEDHCVCCEATYQDSCCPHQHDGESCESHDVESFPETQKFTYADCCKIKSIFLELIAVGQEIIQSIKEAFSMLVLFLNDIFHDWIDLVRHFISEIKYHAPPPDLLQVSIPVTFIDTQFLL